MCSTGTKCLFFKKIHIKIQKYLAYIYSLRIFALGHAKISIYFSKRTYFFQFYKLTFQNTPHYIIYFTLHLIEI